MATNGNKIINFTNYDSLKFSWSRSSYSLVNNTSTITWKLELIATTYGRIDSNLSKPWSVTVNNVKYSGNAVVGISNNTTKTLASGTTTIKHNADGSKNFSFSFSQKFGITFSGKSIDTVSGSGSGTLDTLPRQSAITATTANVGANSIITISKAESNFTHTLTYKFDTLTGTIATKTAESKVTWQIPTSFYNVMKTVKSKVGSITCTTYSNNSAIGTSITNFTVTIDEALNKPTITPVADISSNSTTYTLTGSTTKFIKNYSNINVSMSASAKNGASITSYKITCGGQVINAASGVISKINDRNITYTVIDSRGISTSTTLTRDLIDYIPLTCGLKVVAPTTAGAMPITISGKYFNGSFGSANNTLLVQYRIKENSGSWGSWTVATATKSTNSYTVTINKTGLNYLNSYTIQAMATDKLNTYMTGEIKVKTTPVFDWGENDFNFNVPVEIDTITNNNKSVSVSSLIGAVNALTNNYSLSTSVTNATNWSGASCSALIAGGTFRLYLDGATRASAISGNITNEKVCSVTINHGGKIKNFYGVSFVSGGGGAVTSMYTTNTSISSTHLSFDIYIAATATSSTETSGFFVAPITLNLDKFI